MAMRHGNRAAANRALELIGKHLGMFIERRSIALAAHDDADEYLAKLEALIAAENAADDEEVGPGGGTLSRRALGFVMNLALITTPLSASWRGQLIDHTTGGGGCRRD